MRADAPVVKFSQRDSGLPALPLIRQCRSAACYLADTALPALNDRV
jgi:hypothetical protein